MNLFIHKCLATIDFCDTEVGKPCYRDGLACMCETSLRQYGSVLSHRYDNCLLFKPPLLPTLFMYYSFSQQSSAHKHAHTPHFHLIHVQAEAFTVNNTQTKRNLSMAECPNRQACLDHRRKSAPKQHAVIFF